MDHALLVRLCVLSVLCATCPCASIGALSVETCSATDVSAGRCSDPSHSSFDGDSGDDVALMQVLSKTPLVLAKRSQGKEQIKGAGASSESCSSLANMGSYFNIAVELGTPGQLFDLVLDTGSNELIAAPSCNCVENGKCKGAKKCFDLKNDSSTFSLLTANKSARHSDDIFMATMTYGSGTIVSVVGSDIVQVAGTKADMTGGVFVMTDSSKLRIGGDFQGIFPLGLPGAVALQTDGSPLWAEAAKVSRYSVCFNDAGADGKFSVNIPELANPLENIGTDHWGLDMQGISVGESADASKVLFCSPSSKKAGMTTACGAIPDSGTTLLLGSQEHILKLYDTICDEWPRCRKAAEHKTFPNKSKSQVFSSLLRYCGVWLNEANATIDEIPSVHLHLAGKAGVAQAYTLPASAYIVEAEAEIVKVVTKKLFGVLPVDMEVPTGKTTTMCSAAFSAHDYVTQKNGPVWILGSPLFYQHQVSYDISQPEAATMSIMDTPCTACNGGSSMLSTKARKWTRTLAPRFIRGPLVEPSFNRSRPL